MIVVTDRDRLTTYAYSASDGDADKMKRNENEVCRRDLYEREKTECARGMWYDCFQNSISNAHFNGLFQLLRIKLLGCRCTM